MNATQIKQRMSLLVDKLILTKLFQLMGKNTTYSFTQHLDTITLTADTPQGPFVMDTLKTSKPLAQLMAEVKDDKQYTEMFWILMQKHK